MGNPVEDAYRRASAALREQRPPPFPRFPSDGDLAPDVAWPMTAGVVAFGSTCACSCWIQQRILNISTGTIPPVPTIAGMVSVCAASLASHGAALAARRYLRDGNREENFAVSSRSGKSKRRKGQKTGFAMAKDTLDFGYVQLPLQTVRICVVGILAFKLLGGRFWAISPSSYTNLGSFARRRCSLPATQRYATARERAAIEALGRRLGCHTCGSHMLFSRERVRFIADHMPPKAVAERANRRWIRRALGWKVKFRFYPQCTSCSSKQGSILSRATLELKKRHNHRGLFHSRQASKFFSAFGRSGARFNSGTAERQLACFHGLRPRINHLAGGVVAAVSVAGSDLHSPGYDSSNDANGHRHFHEFAEHWARQMGHAITGRRP